MPSLHTRPDRRAQPVGVNITTSPGSISRTNSAPRLSSAQDLRGDDPAFSASFPRHRGRIPSGSRAAITCESSVRPTRENAPSKPPHALEYPVLPTRVPGDVHQHPGDYLGVGGGNERTAPFVLELFFKLDGIDDVAVVGQWPAVPAPTLHQQRLCIAQFAAAGGEYRVWPMASSPVRGRKSASRKTWDTRPISAAVHLEMPSPLAGSYAGAFLSRDAGGRRGRRR